MTYEELIDAVIDDLAPALPLCRSRADWDAYERLSRLIHETFDIPSTTFTPVMRRLVFGLSSRLRPERMIGVGTFVGYTFAWLARDRHDRADEPHLVRAQAYDVDAVAQRIARHNFARLGHGPRLRAIRADGIAGVGRAEPFDLLYLDLDAEDGKEGYTAALRNALPALAPGAVILAHDACVPRFAESFARYHAMIEEDPRLNGPWVVPIDACGLSIAVRVA